MGDSGMVVAHPGRQSWEQDLLALMMEAMSDGAAIGAIELDGGRHHIINSVAGARHVLVENRGRYASMPFPLAVLGRGLTDPGRTLLRMRPGGQGASRSGVPLAAAIDAAADEMVARFHRVMIAGESIDCVPFFKGALLGLMTQVLFGVKLPDNRLGEAAGAMARLERYRAYQLPPGSLPAKGREHLELQEAFAVEYGFARDLMVQVGFAEIDPSRAAPGFEDLRAWDAQDHLIQSVSRLLMNAYNGPSVCLSWAMWRLARHSEIRSRIARESVAVAGGLSYESSSALSFTRCVLQETLRLHPPAWAIGRLAQADDVIAGSSIGQGDVVTVSTFLMHRREEHWQDPEAFRPERFAADSGRPNPTLTEGYLPFGAGPSGCPAGSFALRELQYIVGRLVAAFDWVLASDEVVRPWALISLHPDPSVQIRIHSHR